jgi:raffinose/stachyose/melibiose transport system permease protein
MLEEWIPEPRGAIGATLIISILPIMIAFILLSNRIVEGIAAGSVKG